MSLLDFDGQYVIAKEGLLIFIDGVEVKCASYINFMKTISCHLDGLIWANFENSRYLRCEVIKISPVASIAGLLGLGGYYLFEVICKVDFLELMLGRSGCNYFAIYDGFGNKSIKTMANRRALNGLFQFCHMPE